MTDWIKFFKEKRNEEAIGEVIESYHNKFIFQTYSLVNIPEYPSFVATLSGNEISIGLITSVSIKPIVPLGDIPKPLKMSREDLAKELKDLVDKYRGICEAVSIGYIKNNEIHQGRPERIPLIHDLVFMPGKELLREMHMFKEPSLIYLPLVYNALPSEERNLFGYYLESFFKKLTSIFTKDELFRILKSIQQDLLENQFEHLSDQVNTSLKRILKNE